MAEVAASLDEDAAWALVRASNTGPNLTLRVEAKSAAGLEAIRDEVLGVLRQHVEVPESAERRSPA